MDIADREITTFSNRLIPKEPIQFFSNGENHKRVFVSITDKPEIWQKDLIISERLFAETIICPFGDYSNHTIASNITKNILKERMKYPGVKENPDFMAIAKTWILPDRLHMGPDASSFFSSESAALNLLRPIFENLKTDPLINYLKIEVSSGMERQLLYSILDSGFRPSLICVKWGHDLDDHIPTAHCAGHLANSGFSLIKQLDDQCLYYYSDQSMYDICSMKTIGLQNPFMQNILETVLSQISSSSAQFDKNSENKVDEGVAE
jgi:hypothetical protein